MGVKRYKRKEGPNKKNHWIYERRWYGQERN